MQNTQRNLKYKKSLLYLNKKGVQKYKIILTDAYKTMGLWVIISGLAGYVNYRFAAYLPFVRRNPRRITMQMIAGIFPLFLFFYHGYKLMEYKRLKGLIAISKDSSYLMNQEQYKESLNQSQQKNQALF